MQNRRMKHLMVATVAGVATAVTALATPGSGVATHQISSPATTVFARASFQDRVDIKIKIHDQDHQGQGHHGKGHHGQGQEVLHVPDARETVVQRVVLSPQGHTGWHSHPGPVIVLVKAGTLTFYSGDDPACGSRTYTAGQSFIDSGQGHVHIARNESATADLELWAVYLDVPPGGAFRDDVPAPGNCAF
jgi:quercetin dioxygenase-like cupin family protein